MKHTEKEFVRSVLPQRPDDANKGTMGTLLSICGSYGMGCLDLTIADKLYRNAREMGLGTKLVQWDNPLWV